MSSTAVETGTLFHISLNVTSIPRAIEFYRVLFGRDAAQVRDRLTSIYKDEDLSRFIL